MDLIKRLAANRKQGLFSSQKQLIEETSADETGEKKPYTNAAVTDSDNYEDIPLKEIKSESHSEETSQLEEEIISVHSGTSKKDEVVLIKKNTSEPGSSHSENIKVVSDDDTENKKSSKSKPVRRKRKKKAHISKEDIVVTENSDYDTIDNIYNIIGFHIMRSELLANHMFLHSPYVRVYIVNYKNGDLVKMQDEKDQQLVTKCFEFYKRGIIVPNWDEFILFNGTFSKSIKKLSNIIIFFVIFDRKIPQDEKILDESICWSFIKVIGQENNININNKLKLQLYECNSCLSDHKAIYDLWKEKPWKSYPSVLYIIIIGARGNVSDEIVNEIKFDISQNKIRENCVKNPNLPVLKPEGITKRLKNEQCKLPNKIMSILQNENGVSTILKFSKCGNYLAYSANCDKKYIIIIYKIPECEELTRLSNHQGVIYDLKWNYAGNKIVSASADSVVYVWDITEPQNISKQRLTHSSFVYTANFCNCNEDILVTGSYDKLIRVWLNKSESGKDVKLYKLTEKLEGHTGFINSVCFSENNEMFYSGDSQGNVFKWANGRNGWVRIMDICIAEFKSRIINDLVLFPGGQKLLVILRDNPPWALNTNTFMTITCYKDGIWDKCQTRGCISPCGTFIFSGNNVWIGSSGELYANYNPIPFNDQSIMSVDYSPVYNILALTTGLENNSIILCSHKHSTYYDANLGLETYATSLLLHSTIMNEDTLKTYPEKSFKLTAKKVQRDIGEKTNTNKEFKLWNLLRKMDGILTNAKKGHVNFKINEDVKTKVFIANEKENGKLKTDADVTISVDLTDFHMRMQRNGFISNDECSSSGTYTVENEKRSPLIKEIVSKNPHEIEESSTLSNAESLEEDSHTYIISIDQ